MMTQDNTIKDFAYNDTLEDRKLKAFMDDCMPDDVNIAGIKRRTYQKIRRQRRRRLVAAVLPLAAVFIGVLVLVTKTVLPKADTPAALTAEVSTEDVISVKVPVGEKMTIMLSDGTRVVANSRSELRYPKTFTGQKREVYAKGEVFFDVAHDAQHPFVVNADGMKVRVLGTKFCVSNFDSSHSTVVLVEGCVAATLKDHDTVTMHPGHLLSVSDGTFQSLTDVDTSEYVSWMDGVLNLHGDDLSTVVRRLNDYYGTDIRVDTTLLSPSLYGKLIYQKDVDGVLESINCLAGTHTATVNGRRVIMRSEK